MLACILALIAAAALGLAWAMKAQPGVQKPVASTPVARPSREQMQALIDRVVPSRYAWAENLGGRLLKVEKRSATGRPDDSVFGVLNAEGEEVVPPIYSHIDHHEGHHRLKVTVGQGTAARSGILDELGNVVVPLVYEHLVPISNMASEPTLVAHQGGKVGYLSMVSGEVLVKPLYDALSGGGRLTDEKGVGVLVAVKGDKRGLIDTNGKVLTAFEFEGFDSADEGLIGRRTKGHLLLKIQNVQLVSVTPHIDPTNALKAGEPVVGIGVRLLPSADDATVVIEAVAPGGPAAIAELRSSDKILEVDDRSVSAMSMEEVVGAVRGAAGSSVKLKVQRETKTWHLTIKRTPIVSP